MILTAKKLAAEIRLSSIPDSRGISITPCPDLTSLEAGGEASVSLRLGRWFSNIKQSRETHLMLTSKDAQSETELSSSTFVPFGRTYVLHPGRFVLGATLERVRLPAHYTAFVVGKSKLGRRGIITETASGVHPGFSGCITLEIANIGEIPVQLIPGIQICQLFFHTMSGDVTNSTTSLAGQRKPRVGKMSDDKIIAQLMRSAPR